MRVASLESVLAVATLVSAAVVVLWGLRILYGAWTSRSLRRFKLLPRGFLSAQATFRGGGGSARFVRRNALCHVVRIEDIARLVGSDDSFPPPCGIERCRNDSRGRLERRARRKSL